MTPFPPKRPLRERPRAIDKATDLVARREHSARELRGKLAVRGYSAAEASGAVAQLQSRDFQSDDRFGAGLARRRAGQGYGPRRIQAELKSHGLADLAIRAVLAALDVDWAAIAASQLRRRFGARAAGGAADRAARAGFLLRRGFDPATVRAITRAEVDDPGREFEG
jgi:regulatory protein